ncbi:unnamed protein product [Didymodactylos carnosus]|uniref:Uncharacterized protein n=1 Tax=Didymodactylos carnosus TaxID=1234261 RepID=A0A8S2GHL0_9BILA|nr:unnamed protein product [Didymodactylos carnosus]CAF3507557.1 unnamed protein product [Didymodactylos carnosus]CAF3917699.1 unnamed protein product [Didymodactylos carnosus]
MFRTPPINAPIQRALKACLEDPGVRWILAYKIDHSSEEGFKGLNISTYPNRVAPPLSHQVTGLLTWNSAALKLWTLHLFFPKVVAFALFKNNKVVQFCTFRLHKTAVENWFNHAHTPDCLTWKLSKEKHYLNNHMHKQDHFSLWFYIAVNTNMMVNGQTNCTDHRIFMFINGGEPDVCGQYYNITMTVKISAFIVFSPQSYPVSYHDLTFADYMAFFFMGDSGTAS